jgi:hypothetical protein
VRIKRAWFDVASIETMNGELFEWWVAEGLHRQGWHVELTPSSGDYGADLIATKDGQCTAVQVKRYTKQVGVSAGATSRCRSSALEMHHNNGHHIIGWIHACRSQSRQGHGHDSDHRPRH